MTVNNPDHYAVVIGIDAYHWLRPLGAARADAASFVEWLVSKDAGGLPVANIKLIQSPPKPPPDPFARDPEPLEHHIVRALKEIGIDRPPRRIGQRFYFYFAGHGVGPTFRDVGMLLANAAMDGLDKNVGLQPCLKMFHETGFFDEVVFIVDCCRGDPRYEVPTRGLFTFPKADPPPRVYHCAVLAGLWGENAYAISDGPAEERRGILTKAVLEGLNGAPDALDKSGRVTSFTLRDYVYKRVAELTEKMRLGQEPEVDSPQELVFATRSVPTVEVRIQAPLRVDGTLVLHDDRGAEIERRLTREATAANPWAVTLLYNARYIIRYDGSDAPPFVLEPKSLKRDPRVFKVPIPQP